MRRHSLVLQATRRSKATAPEHVIVSLRGINPIIYTSHFLQRNKGREEEESVGDWGKGEREGIYISIKIYI